MENNIKQILNDLYNIDASLRAHEAELIKIINKVLKSKPDTKLDGVFVARLRREISAKAEALTPQGRETGLFNFMQFNKFAYAGLGAVMMLVIILPALWLTKQSSNRPLALENNALSEAAKIARLNAGAFGALDGLGAGTAGALGRGEGGGGAAPLAVSDSTAAVEGLGGDAARIGLMPPFYRNYEFKYEGEDISGLLSDAYPVYKRSKDLSLGRQYAQAFTADRLGYFDLNKFDNLEIASLNLTENREFGYSAYFSLYDNSFGISANWEKWPRPEQDCRDEACYARYRLRPSDVPADSEIYAIAASFLGGFGIDLDAYGEPSINKYWEREIMMSPEPENVYVPEVVTVVYPLVLDGKTVKDEGGNPAGVYVDVNIRHKRGYGINNLFVPNYEQSDYAAVTDAAALIETAENGGNAWLYRDPNAAETVTLALGTPVLELVRYWWYDQDKPSAGSQELYIPALIFPVSNREEAGEYYRNSVTVPLVKDIFDSIRNRDNGLGGGIEPMPALYDANGNEVRPESPKTGEALDLKDQPLN